MKNIVEVGKQKNEQTNEKYINKITTGKQTN